MFNFYTDEDGPLVTRWARVNSLKAELLTRGNMVVQTKRSLNDVKLNESDVWDSKNFFAARIREIILQENFKHRSMKDLQETVLQMTKYLVEE